MEELEKNINDAYTMVMEENSKLDINVEIKTKDFVVQV